MARPLAIPSPPPDYKPTNIPAIDSFFFGRWPHLFTLLAREYRVPSDLLVVLMFLWEATVGAKEGPNKGYLAQSQVPEHLVRERNLLKWLDALVASTFFTMEKAGPHDHKGSRYTYDEDVSPQAWEAFFQVAEYLNGFKNWDDVDRDVFARWFTPDKLKAAQENPAIFQPRARATEMVEAVTSQTKFAEVLEVRRLGVEPMNCSSRRSVLFPAWGVLPLVQSCRTRVIGGSAGGASPDS
jgi:hypothetical protein